MYVLSPAFFKNSKTVDNRLQHDFQSYAWELHAPTLIFFFHGLLVLQIRIMLSVWKGACRHGKMET